MFFEHKMVQCVLGITVFGLCPFFTAQADQKPAVLSGKINSLLDSKQAEEVVPAFIYFKDKGANLADKLILARKSLSTKALHRRIINRGEQNVVTINDIPLAVEYVQTVSSKVNKVRHKLKNLNAMSVEASPRVLADISALPFVKSVELVRSIARAPEPEVQVSLDNKEIVMAQPEAVNALDYGRSFTQNEQINVPAVHDLGYDGSGVVIAIFDSGFNRLSHEVFDSIEIAGTRDFVNGDTDVGDGGRGVGHHGTNTLSTIGGFSPGQLIGPAYGATYYLAKTENTESELHIEEDNWCAAAEWAEEQGADIITSSLGYRDGFDAGEDYSASDMDGDTAIITICADAVAADGVVVVNSAGNSGNSSQNTLGAPSDGHFVLAVGAVTSSGNRSSFSSVGLSADGRIKPDVMAMGSSVRVASSRSNTGYTNVNGTSFSCPLTAGVVALVLDANPNLSAAQVRDILRNTASRANSPGRLFGYGIVNALEAVEEALSLGLNAAFSVSANELTINLTDESSTPSGRITQWAWDFGDGNTSSAQNPIHTYSEAGTYTIGLVVTNSNGETATTIDEVSVTDGVAEPCEGAINFLDNTTVEYSSSAPGEASVSNDGCSITLTGNEWRITNGGFNIGPNTVLTFDFLVSGAAGEIQGVGFDTDTTASRDRIFQLEGTQNWGITEYTYDGGRQSFRIPVGEHYTGSNMRFVIANDNDSGTPTNSVTVSNVRVLN